MEETALVTQVPFDSLPPESRLSSFGVNYAQVKTAGGSRLYVTRYGWPFLRHLQPEQWHEGKRYLKAGQKLPGSTGSVYRVPSQPPGEKAIDLVVKFSRVGQEVPLEIATSFPDGVSTVDLGNARFNSPFEEFGLVMELREGRYGSQSVKARTQRPMAIYVTGEEHELWTLGRTETRFALHRQLLEMDQIGKEEEAAIALDIRREYVVLYSWVKGENAEDFCDKGLLREEELERLTPRVMAELAEKGFRVLDTKPKHFILRQRCQDGRLVQRNGQLVYSLVDFELLERTEEYKQRFRSTRRAKYWYIQHQDPASVDKPFPPPLQPVKLFGVDYVFGPAPSGGKLWVVGKDPDLFDYFLPDRWRRTPRVRLSPINEVYRTRTRDHIHVVYRRSRAGERPHVDPFYDQGRRIREYGYNSPFEEVAVALELRQRGIPTAHPRAVYRTGHQSVRAEYLADKARYLSHQMLLTPEDPPEPVLSASHDYYTLWGSWRGIDPMTEYRPVGHWAFIDADFAYEQGVVTRSEFEEVVHTTRERLSIRAPRIAGTESHQFLLPFDSEGKELPRDAQGRIEVVLGIDALNLFDMGLLSETQYRGLIERQRQRMRSVGFEALNLGGHHLLLAINPDGQIKTDASGHPEVTLCNFELIERLD